MPRIIDDLKYIAGLDVPLTSESMASMWAPRPYCGGVGLSRLICPGCVGGITARISISKMRR